jgi:hypothetical protein
VQREGLTAMIDGVTQALDALGRALDGNDAAAVSAATLALRPAFLRVYYWFGDFHAIIWTPPASSTR